MALTVVHRPARDKTAQGHITDAPPLQAGVGITSKAACKHTHIKHEYYKKNTLPCEGTAGHMTLQFTTHHFTECQAWCCCCINCCMIIGTHFSRQEGSWRLQRGTSSLCKTHTHGSDDNKQQQ